MTSRRAAAALLAGAVALLVACSGGEADRADTPETPSAATEQPDDFVWREAGARRSGLDPEALRAVARDARRSGSTCLLVVRDGRIAGEWYWRDGAPNTAEPAFSVTKSVTSTLVGIAAGDGDLDLDDPAARYVDEWRGTRSRAITVRHLLSNDSGREWSRLTDYVGLIAAEDRSSYAVGLRQSDAPGTVWNYNNAAIQTLDRVLSAATGTPTADYAEDRLFAPLGMSDTRMTGDASGLSTSTAFGLETTCRDLARFGLLFESGGAWQGEQVVPSSWVQQAVGGPSQELNRSYGLLWWVNSDGELVPDAPRNLYAAIGFGGQVLMVDPGSDTIVVRLGEPGEGDFGVADAARIVTDALARER